MAERVRLAEADASIAAETSEDAVLHGFHNLSLRNGQTESTVPGSIIIKRGHIEWIPDGEQAPAWTLDFHDITMHAVVRADEENPAALYLQVCTDDGDDYISSEEEAVDTTAENGNSTLGPDLWLIPSDPAIVSVLYDAFSKGAERNPDEDSESDEEGGICFNEEEVFGASDLALNRQEIAELENGDASRFDDAEEEDPEAS